MNKEPCLTLKELAALKGVCYKTIIRRAKKKPYPQEAVYEERKTAPMKHRSFKGHAVRYRKSDLLQWFEDTNE